MSEVFWDKAIDFFEEPGVKINNPGVKNNSLDDDENDDHK